MDYFTTPAQECATNFEANHGAATASNETHGGHPLTDQPHERGIITPAQRGSLGEVAKLAQDDETGALFWGPGTGRDGSPNYKKPVFWIRAWAYPIVNDVPGWSRTRNTRGILEAVDIVCSPEGKEHGLLGVGLLMKALRPEVVILDFDAVLEADGTPNRWGRWVLEHFAETYIEVSPSGRGLRVVMTGVIDWISTAAVTLEDVPKSSERKPASVEVYTPASGVYTDSDFGAKFVRMTGAVVRDCAGTPGPAQRGLDVLDALLVERKGTRPELRDRAGVDDPASPAAAWAELRELTNWKERNASDVMRSLKATAQKRPESMTAKMMAGDFSPWGNNRSGVDYFTVREVIKRGAGDFATVLEVWKWTRAYRHGGKPDTRRGYVQTTIINALDFILDKWEEWEAERVNPKHAQAKAEAVEALKELGDEPETTKAGGLASTVGNALLMLQGRDAWAGSFALNQHTRKVERTRSLRVFEHRACDEPGNLSDDDVTRVQAGLGRQCGIKLHAGQVRQAIMAAAQENAFHPVRDRVNELAGQWDGVPRLRTWLQDFMAADPEYGGRDLREYLAKVGTGMLVSAVRRIRNPGSQFDTVLTLVGGEGGGKSSGFRVLADVLMEGLFTDSVRDLENRVTLVEETEGKVIVELAELAAIRSRAELAALKATITARFDNRRKPYAIDSEDVLRSFIFVATVNGTMFLPNADAALRRRFWPVHVTSSQARPIDFDALANVAPQLWAEAAVLEAKGAPVFIAPSETEAMTEWQYLLDETYDPGIYAERIYDLGSAWVRGEPRGPDSKSGGKAIPHEYCSLPEVAEFVGDEDARVRRNGADTRLTRELGNLGFAQTRRKTGMVWFIPADKRDRFRE